MKPKSPRIYSLNKVWALTLVAMLAPVTLAAHASEAITADVELGMLQLDLVNVRSNRILVCPPGLDDQGEQGCAKIKRDRTLAAPGVPPITPQAYLQMACPEVKIISLSVSSLHDLMGSVVAGAFPQTVTLVTSGVCDPRKSTLAGK